VSSGIEKNKVSTLKFRMSSHEQDAAKDARSVLCEQPLKLTRPFSTFIYI